MVPQHVTNLAPGERVRYFRCLYGVSLDELAFSAGIDVMRLAAIEACTRPLDAVMGRRLAEALDEFLVPVFVPTLRLVEEPLVLEDVAP